MNHTLDVPSDHVDELLVAIESSTTPHEREVLEDQLVRACLPLAQRLASKYRNRGADLEDLEAVANLALVKAVRGFEPAKGSFHGYAVATMLGEIKKYFRDYCWMIRPTRTIQELQPRIRQAQEELLERGVEPTRESLAAHLDVTPEAVTEALGVSSHFTARSLDAPSGASGRPLVETVAADGGGDAYVAVDDLLTVAPGCAGLSDDDKELLRLRFFEEMTQIEIARIVGVSQMQVSRRLSGILQKIRDAAAIPAA